MFGKRARDVILGEAARVGVWFLNVRAFQLCCTSWAEAGWTEVTVSQTKLGGQRAE